MLKKIMWVRIFFLNFLHFFFKTEECILLPEVIFRELTVGSLLHFCNTILRHFGALIRPVA